MSEATRAILTDIEGTTTRIAFVTEVLFPYARERLGAWIAANPERAAPHLAAVPGEDKLATLLGWMDRDAKETPLKAIQGMIWAEGYAAGGLKAHVYPDAAATLRRWHGAGLRLAVYSSGSIEAQRLLFGHSDQGDLTPLFSGWFDTTTGPKREAASYVAIATALALPSAAIHFLSDTPQEIDAARAAGLKATLVSRDGGAGVRSFDEVIP